MVVRSVRRHVGDTPEQGLVYIGTSGFAYPEWTPHFYPAGTRDGDRLRYYATRFNTVEVNNTFYRLPSPEVIQRWKNSVGPGFRFSIKASQRITHRFDFGEADGFINLFFSRMALFQPSLGSLLFQFPPTFGDLGNALHFIDLLKDRTSRWVNTVLVIEVCNPGLWIPDFFNPLVAAGLGLCFNDAFLEPDQWPEPGTVAYVRLRREVYTRRAQQALVRQLQKWSSQGKTCFVFFQHEGCATDLALALKKQWQALSSHAV